MSSVVVQIADALVEILRGISWDGVTYRVRRTYLDCLDEQLGEATQDVDVAVIVPGQYDTVDLETRGSVEREAAFPVVVRRKFNADDIDQATGAIQEQLIDELMELVETLSEGAVAAAIASGEAGSRFVPPVDHDPIYRRDHLRTLRQFTAGFTLTFAISSAL